MRHCTELPSTVDISSSHHRWGLQKVAYPTWHKTQLHIVQIDSIDIDLELEYLPDTDVLLHRNSTTIAFFFSGVWISPREASWWELVSCIRSCNFSQLLGSCVSSLLILTCYVASSAMTIARWNQNWIGWSDIVVIVVISFIVIFRMRLNHYKKKKNKWN